MKDKQKAEEIAAQRVQLLSPLTRRRLGSRQGQRELKAIKFASKPGLSERTVTPLFRERYRQEGFSGLKATLKSKGRQPAEAVIAEPLMEKLYYCVAKYLVAVYAQIIQILEWEGFVFHQVRFKRSTLQEKLTQRGYSSQSHAHVCQSQV